MSKESIEVVYIVLSIVAILIISAGSIFIPPYFEMRSYNKLVCPEVEVTYWDALFTNLVVQQSTCPK